MPLCAGLWLGADTGGGVYGLGWLGAFLLGALLGGVFARGWLRTYGLFALGLLIGFFFVLAVYLNAPPDYAHDPTGCSDCEEYWGRWWEPSFVVFLAGIGYFAYLLGIGIGAATRGLMSALRRGHGG
jgi:hypothetical protein